jgi:glycosyltransferase involved in cell wall biosynthesis
MIPPIVPSFVECPDSETEYRHSLGYSSDNSVVLFVGNLKRNKGIDVLIQAFIELANTFPAMRLVVTTELNHEDLLERKNRLQNMVARHGFGDRVVWLELVDDMPNLIRDVDVVVVPFLDLNGISDYPLIVLEAMAVGTPVIATDVGGTSEVLSEDAGILIPPGNVDALSGGLVNIMSNRRNNRTGNKSSSSLDCFSTYAVGRRYQSLFLEYVTKID